MKASYSSLRKTLIDKKMTRPELRKATNLSKGTIAKMGKGEPMLVALTLVVKWQYALL